MPSQHETAQKAAHDSATSAAVQQPNDANGTAAAVVTPASATAVATGNASGNGNGTTVAAGAPAGGTAAALTTVTAAATATAAASAVGAAAIGGDAKVAPDAAAVRVDTNGRDAKEFRNYTDSSRHATVQKFYAEQHAKQSYAFVSALERKYNGGGLCRMGLWECLEYLDTFVDDSDPDTEHSQMQHALQTAEAIRAAYPSEAHDWFALVGLIHDLGKLLSPKGKEPQYCVVGDTHPVGCAFAPENVFHAFFAANPDATHPVYSTVNGVYTPHCGLNNVKMSYGHDEFLYQTVVRNKTTLPAPALAIIRFHSFYPWHSGGAYRHLMDATDHDNLKWVQAFQKFDLYSKAHVKYDPKALKPVYEKLIAKYFPHGTELQW